jgi:hypothetical protein
MKTASKFQVRRRTRERRYGLIVGIILFATLSLGLSLTMEMPGFNPSRALPEGVSATFGPEGRTANIILEPAPNRCKQMIFDNDTGRIVESNRPCDKSVILNDKGVPMGTVRRLDAIAKSFSGQ